MGVISRDARSLDYSSYRVMQNFLYQQSRSLSWVLPHTLYQLDTFIYSP